MELDLRSPRDVCLQFYCSSWDGVVSLLAFPAAESKERLIVIGGCQATSLLP